MADENLTRAAPHTPAPDDPSATTASTPAAALPAAQPASAHRYALGAEIARGGMGAVYRATDTVLGREVAVKVLAERFGPGSGPARRFDDEARITGQLQHPGVPPVHDLGELPDGRPFLVMKLIKGETLEELLKARPDPAHERGRFVAAFEQVCHTVAYAHAHGVVHRDLKPLNVMVGAFNEVQVMDWGLAKVLAAPGGDTDPGATTGATEVRTARPGDGHTQSGSVMGTPAYMAPEQALGAVELVNARSDVFGLGGILATVLTGRPPFVGETGESTRLMAAQGKLGDCFARLDASGADPALVALCKRCLAPDPADRPTDAAAVARAVGELRAAADERARRAELDARAATVREAEQRKRRRAVLAVGTALVLVLAAGVAGTAVGLVRAERARADESEQRGAAERARDEAAEQRGAAERARDAAAAALVAERKARTEADQSYELARESVVGVAWVIPDVLRQAVFAREAEKKVTAALAELMEKQLALDATRGLPDRAMHALRLRLGDLRHAQVVYAEARQHYEAALAISSRAVRADPRPGARVLADHGTTYQKLGAHLVAANTITDAGVRRLQTAVNVFREVVAASGSDVPTDEAKFLLAGALHDLSDGLDRRQDYDAAARAAREAVALFDEVCKLPPSAATVGRRGRLADARVRRGEIEYKRGDTAAAEEQMRAGVTVYEEEVAADLYNIDLRRRAASAHRALGDLLLFVSRYEDARLSHARDIFFSRSVVRTPEIVLGLLDLSYALYRSGTLALKRGDTALARQHYTECARVRLEASRAQPRNEVTKMALARALARAGEHMSAVAVFDPVARRYPFSLQTAEQKATIYGLCADAVRAGRPLAHLAADERAVYDQYRNWAFDGLKAAVTNWEWLDIVGLKTNPDWESLHGDPRFDAAVRVVEERIERRNRVAPPPRAK